MHKDRLQRAVRGPRRVHFPLHTSNSSGGQLPQLGHERHEAGKAVCVEGEQPLKDSSAPPAAEATLTLGRNLTLAVQEGNVHAQNACNRWSFLKVQVHSYQPGPIPQPRASPEAKFSAASCSSHVKASSLSPFLLEGPSGLLPGSSVSVHPGACRA